MKSIIISYILKVAFN